jgi:hypothetical protein
VAKDYAEFLDHKAQLDGDFGFDPVWTPEFLFDFQKALVEWALRKGRAAIFADCGLGKTPMQLVWAENVRRKTGKPVLILTPLAVSAQTIGEGMKFGIEVSRSQDGTPGPGLTVTNYERLERFNPQDFSGCVCDESSILKSFDGARRTEITAFMRKMPFRLLCTATAAPNDFIELGTSSEALGYLGSMDMLNRFFKNDQNTSDTRGKWVGHGGGQARWRFKGHAEGQFWRWVCSWARACRRPSDLGFSDDGFALPELIEQDHLVEAARLPDGKLFDMPAIGLWEEREEARSTLHERCEKAAELVNGTGQPAVLWCHLNDEGKALAKMIPDCVEVSGADSVEAKEEAFQRFGSGDVRVLVIKPRIGAWGLNWQHCAHMTVFPSHSYESYYQSIRRCWRFGQKRPVTVDIVTTAGGMDVMKNLQRKSDQADRMFSALVGYMNQALGIARNSEFTKDTEVPSWL